MMDALHLHDCIHVQCAKQRLAVTCMDFNSFPEREKEESNVRVFPYGDVKPRLCLWLAPLTETRGTAGSIYELLRDPAHIAHCIVSHGADNVEVT